MMLHRTWIEAMITWFCLFGLLAIAACVLR